MKTLRQALRGIMIALASIGLIIGGFSLSLTEGNITSTLVPTHTLIPTYPVTSQAFTPSVISLTPLPSVTPTPSYTLTPTRTSSLSLLPTNCTPPVGWLPYVVQSDDTIEKIASLHRISISELQQANCLLMTTGLLPGAVLYVPPEPTQTQVPAPTQYQVPCGRPYGWIVYIVQQGDTLYRLSQTFGISVGELQRANCMGSSTILHTGQTLYVPPWAVVHTPLPTIPALFTPTPTNTPETSLPSVTPFGLTETPIPPTDIPVPPTDTQVPPTEMPTTTP
jgi:LysM repeat protein